MTARLRLQTDSSTHACRHAAHRNQWTSPSTWAVKAVRREAHESRRGIEEVSSNIHRGSFLTVCRRGKDAVLQLVAAADETRAAPDAVLALKETALTPGLLPGTGDARWRAMWTAVKAFSADAYRAAEFPVRTVGSRCPFCQQEIGPDAPHRAFCMPLEQVPEPSMRHPSAHPRSRDPNPSAMALPDIKGRVGS